MSRTVYKWVYTPDGDLLECQRCGVTAPLHPDAATRTDNGFRCEVCYETLTGPLHTPSAIQGAACVVLRAIQQIPREAAHAYQLADPDWMHWDHSQWWDLSQQGVWQI